MNRLKVDCHVQIDIDAGTSLYVLSEEERTLGPHRDFLELALHLASLTSPYLPPQESLEEYDAEGLRQSKPR